MTQKSLIVYVWFWRTLFQKLDGFATKAWQIFNEGVYNFPKSNSWVYNFAYKLLSVSAIFTPRWTATVKVHSFQVNRGMADIVDSLLKKSPKWTQRWDDDDTKDFQKVCPVKVIVSEIGKVTLSMWSQCKWFSESHNAQNPWPKFAPGSSTIRKVVSKVVVMKKVGKCDLPKWFGGSFWANSARQKWF